MIEGVISFNLSTNSLLFDELWAFSQKKSDCAQEVRTRANRRSAQFAMYLGQTAIFFTDSSFYLLGMIMGTIFALIEVRLSRVLSRYWRILRKSILQKWCSYYFDLILANDRTEWRQFLSDCRRDHSLSNATKLSKNGWVLAENEWKNELACIIVRTAATEFRPPLLTI